MNICHAGDCKDEKLIPEKLTVYLSPNGYRHSPNYRGIPICLECYKRLFIGKGANPKLGPILL